MDTHLDIETMPGQGLYDGFLAEAQNNFKAPSTLTKAKACADLGLVGNDAKFTSKDDAILKWEARFSQEKAPEVAEENWRRTALDGSKGEIFSIAFAVEGGDVRCLSRALMDDGSFSSESVLLQDFYSSLSASCNGRPPFFIGHYVAGFDLKFIFQRSIILGVKPQFKLPFDGRHSSDFYDNQTAWAGFKGRMSQDNLCKALGIEGKPGDIDGSKVWDFIKAGDTDRVVEYNIDDVVKSRKIYNRLNFIK
jgi:hypothetical protein